MQTIPVELMTLSAGERHISELEDIEALMRQYKAKVFRFVAFSTSDRDAAESITQDCFLKAYKSRNQFRGDCSVSTWLMRIAFNLIRDYTKTQKFRFWKTAAAHSVDVEEMAPYLSNGSSTPETQLLAKERIRMVQDALQEVSAKQRSVFLMRFVEDQELSEIATVTGMSVHTVKTHLYRAVGTIRARFGASL
jgi:RNA polymerase sigma-70 factor, ECF subfamily